MQPFIHCQFPEPGVEALDRGLQEIANLVDGVMSPFYRPKNAPVIALRSAEADESEPERPEVPPGEESAPESDSDDLHGYPI